MKFDLLLNRRRSLLLKPVIAYTHYAVFHGINGHLPSIPNTYYYEEQNLLCYTKGYKTAHVVIYKPLHHNVLRHSHAILH